MANASQVANSNSKDWLGHPRGLFILFFTEMWERFSFYGMRALLVLYMTKYLIAAADGGMTVLGWETIRPFIVSVLEKAGITGEGVSSQAIASQIYGFYTSFVYITPILGGLLADTWLGKRKSVYLGGVLMAIGHFLMAIESYFFIALFFIVLGNGCFKPNISTQVGAVYPEGDKRVDGAYTIFYMGINIGAFFAALVCGTLGQKFGWHYGFGAAGVGMMVGLVVYHFGRGYLPAEERMAPKSSAQGESQDEPDFWKRVIALLVVFALNMAFWAIYEQQGNTLQLWASDKTNWSFLGFTIPDTWYQSFNPFFIFVFAPLLDRFWAMQARKNKEPTSVTKMGIGCFLVGIAFVVMIAASKVVPEGEKGSVMWLASTTWIFTMGELYLSPIGLALVSKVAPKRLVSTMMGLFFGSIALGNYAAGFIGSFYSVIGYDRFFAILVVLGVAAAFAFFIANRPLRKIIGTKS